LNTKVTGRVWKYGDNVDTDTIYPGVYLEVTDPKKMADYAMLGYGEKFSKNVRKNDIVVAGKNFGCGSSREHAPIALKEAGVSLVIAESFSRLYYRNSLNIGLPLIACPKIFEFVNEGDRLEVNIESGQIRNENTGETVHCSPMSKFELEVFEKGGVIRKLEAEKLNTK
jgi:3-isopropylmalate/(R)-2-methylmalate dehydratase small subunit